MSTMAEAQSPHAHRGWQAGKTLDQCNRYMLDHQLACDIKFVIHSPDGTSRDFRAHKYMLMSRSPVFEAMLSGDYREANEDIVIIDIEPDIFKDLLIFIYTDDVTVTAHSVLYLMAAARKYLLDLLAEKCKQFLLSNINNDNGCTILSHSVLQSEHDLARTCLEYIAPRTSMILKTDAYLEMAQPSLKALLEYDDLIVDSEVEVFEACKEWAKHNSRKDCGDEVSDETIRNTLGDCLYQIRFSTMECKDFNACLGFSNILTDREIRLFNMCSSLKDDSIVAMAMHQIQELGYNPNPRRTAPQCVLRRLVVSRKPKEVWSTPGRPDAIDFRTSQAIQLLGVSVFCGKFSGDTHACRLQVTDGTSGDVADTSVTVTADGVEDTKPVMLPAPVLLQPYTDHTVAVTLKGPDTYRGCLGDRLVEKDGVVFTFSHSNSSSNHTDTNCGQIPELIFRP